MHNLKEHIIIKIVSLILVMAVALPSFVKAMHTFETHEHDICVDKITTHIHEIDFDCEFYKFNLNNAYSFIVNARDIFDQKQNHKIVLSQYFYISDYQRLCFSLRGPPFLV